MNQLFHTLSVKNQVVLLLIEISTKNAISLFLNCKKRPFFKMNLTFAAQKLKFILFFISVLSPPISGF